MNEQFSKLIKEFGEDPFTDDGICIQVDKCNRQLREEIQKNRKNSEEYIQKAITQSLHCVQLIEKTLEITSKYHQTVNALIHKDELNDHEKNEIDRYQNEDEIEDLNDKLLLEDLIHISDEMKDTAKQISKVGIVKKTSKASQMILADVDMNVFNGSSISTEESIQKFNDLYMEEFTAAFGDEIDQFRKEDRFETSDISFLISSIYESSELFTNVQKQILLNGADKMEE